MVKKWVSSLLVFLMIFSNLLLLPPESVKAEQIEKTQVTEGEKKEIEKEKPKQEAKVVKEIEEKRTKNTKHFQMSDGSYTAKIYAGDINYIDENGEYLPLDTALYDEDTLRTLDISVSKESKKAVENIAKQRGKSSAETGYKPLKVNYDASLPKNFLKGYYMGVGDDRLDFIPVGANPSKGVLSADKSSLDYIDAWENTDVNLRILGDGIKETITLKNDLSPTVFTYEVKGDLADDLTSGQLHLEPAWLIDENGVYRDVDQVVRNDRDKIFIDLTPNIAGLKFPIIIDPTITVNPPVNRTTDWFTLDNSGEYTGNSYGYTVSQYKNNNKTTYFKFNYDFSSLGPIIDAKMQSQIYTHAYDSFDMDLSRVTEPVSFPDRTFYRNGVWNLIDVPNTGNMPAMQWIRTDRATQSSSSGDIFVWDGLTQTVQSWQSGANYGLVLSSLTPQSGDAAYGQVSFWARYTYLTVTYLAKPLAPTVTSPNGGESVDAGHNITWNHAYDEDTPSTNLKYQIQLSTNNGTSYSDIVWLTNSGVSSYLYNFSGQPETTQAIIRIRAYDGNSYGPWDYSNSVFTINHNKLPNAPTITSYYDGQKIKDNTPTLSWNFTDPDVGDYQGWYQIVASNNGWASNMYDSGVVQSGNKSATLPAFPDGIYSFAIRTWDQSGQWTPPWGYRSNITIDTMPPSTPVISANTAWTNNNVSVSVIPGIDSLSGVNRTEYSLSGATVTGWIPYTGPLTIINQGKTTVSARTIDNAGNTSPAATKVVSIDKTAPITDLPSIVAMLNQISITPNANDPISKLTANPYIYNRNGTDLTGWVNTTPYTDSGLTPNTQYTYKYAAIDNAGNVNWSSPVSRYTLALDPTEVQVTGFNIGSIVFNIVQNPENIVIPEVKITLKVKGTNTIRAISDWNSASSRTITGLLENESYDVYLQTRNGNQVSNAEIKLSGSSTPPLKNSNGQPIDEIPQMNSVKNFIVSSSTANSLTVTWESASNQEYQLYLMTEANEKIATSSWITGTIHTFNDPSLLSNTQYTPYIITRSTNPAFGGFTTNPLKIANETRSYTNADMSNKASYTSGENSITMTLDVSDLKNSTDTQYQLKNNVTGQIITVTNSNPVWTNTGLIKEAYYQYSARAINKNGELSYFVNLLFADGNEAHTNIMELVIDDTYIGAPDVSDIIDLDAMDLTNPLVPVTFDLNNMAGRTVKYNGNLYYLTKNKMEVLGNTTTNKIAAKSYSISPDGYGFSDWRGMSADGTFSEQIFFNQPGIYNAEVKFKNYYSESEPLTKGYLADWINPTINATSMIPGQTAVTDNKFTVTLSGSDNVSPFLFWTMDDATWYPLPEGYHDVTTSNVQISTDGALNNLRIIVSDLIGNKTEKTIPFWGIQQ